MDKTNETQLGGKVIQLRLRANLLRNHAQLSTESRRPSSVIASGALATILFAVVALNLKLSDSEKKSTRSPATVNEIAQTEWSTTFLRTLTQKRDRQLANVATTPTLTEQLQLGWLEGKYSVSMRDGHVSEIVFQDNVNGSDRPKYLEHKEEFLKHFKSLISNEFDSVSLASETVKDGQIVQRYALIGPKSSPVAHATFISDQYSRFLKMKVENE